ncbi:MAG TPA: putative Ig domain-containing protein, partial [Rhodothermales bacterium]
MDSALAQTHFNDCVSMTGSSANVIVPASIEPTLNGSPLANGDEIAVFTTDGTCAGAATWTGGNLSLTVWGDDAVTTEKDGFQPGEELTFRLWDASADTEAVEVTVVYDASQPFYRTEGTYADNALYAPITFEASYDADVAVPSAPTLAIPLNGAVGVNTTPTFIWSPIALADTYNLQVATDQSFDTLWAEIENLTSTQYALLELPSGSVLYWRVRGENAAGEGEYSAAFSFSTVARQKGPNVAPSFTTSPLMQVTAGTPYLYDALTEDANEDAVVITALVLPSWLTFQADGPTATLTGTPVSGHVGSHEVTLRVEDPDGAWDEQAFTIVVKPSGLPNAAPVASAVIPDQALSLGTAKTIDLNDHF